MTTKFIWQSSIVNEQGDTQASAQVEIRVAATDALATLYEDRDGTTPKANPFNADLNGYAFAYMLADRYNITATKSGFSRTWSDVLVMMDPQLVITSVNEVSGGDIVIDPDDLDDSATTNKFVTQTEVDKLNNITVTQAVDLDAIETRVNSLDAAVVLRGTWDASAGSFPGGGTAEAGDSYIVSVAGTVDSIAFSVNDRIIAIVDNASTATYAANWLKADYSDLVTSVNGQTGAVTTADEKSKVSANDTTAGYLNGKLVAGTNITLTENNDGDDETLTIDASGGGASASYSSDISAVGLANLDIAVPSGATQIAIRFNELSVSTAGEHLIIRLGDSGGIETNGYVASSSYVRTTAAADSEQYTTSFGVMTIGGFIDYRGVVVLTRFDGAGTNWAIQGVLNDSAGTTYTMCGIADTDTELTTVRISASDGSNFAIGGIDVQILS